MANQSSVVNGGPILLDPNQKGEFGFTRNGAGAGVLVFNPINNAGGAQGGGSTATINSVDPVTGAPTSQAVVLSNVAPTTVDVTYGVNGGPGSGAVAITITPILAPAVDLPKSAILSTIPGINQIISNVAQLNNAILASNALNLTPFLITMSGTDQSGNTPLPILANSNSIDLFVAPQGAGVGVLSGTNVPASVTDVPVGTSEVGSTTQNDDGSTTTTTQGVTQEGRSAYTQQLVESNNGVSLSESGDAPQTTINNANVNVDNSSSAAINGDNNTISGGTNSSLSLNGNADTVSAGDGSTVDATGGYVQTVVTGWFYWNGWWPIIQTNNLSNDVNLNNGTIDIGSGSTASINGSADSISTDNSNVNITGSSDNVSADSSNVNITGSSDSISADNSNVNISGQNDDVAATNSSVDFSGDQSGDSVSGSGDSGNYDGGYVPPPPPPDEGGYGYGFVGGKSKVSTAVGTDIGSIARYDLSQGDQSGATLAEAALRQIHEVIDNNVQSAVLDGAKWDKSVVTWNFAGATGDAEATARQAFAEWGAVTGIDFKEATSAATPPDITLGWANFDTSNSGVIGFTQPSGSGELIQIENPSEDPLVVGADGQLTYSGTDVTLAQVLLHEIGHALGFGDNANPNSIMSYSLDASNQTFSSADIAAAQALYGSQNAILDNPGLISDSFGHALGAGALVAPVAALHASTGGATAH